MIVSHGKTPGWKRAFTGMISGQTSFKPVRKPGKLPPPICRYFGALRAAPIPRVIRSLFTSIRSPRPPVGKTCPVPLALTLASECWRYVRASAYFPALLIDCPVIRNAVVHVLMPNGCGGRAYCARPRRTVMAVGCLIGIASKCLPHIGSTSSRVRTMSALPSLPVKKTSPAADRRSLRVNNSTPVFGIMVAVLIPGRCPSPGARQRAPAKRDDVFFRRWQ